MYEGGLPDFMSVAPPPSCAAGYSVGPVGMLYIELSPIPGKGV